MAEGEEEKLDLKGVSLEEWDSIWGGEGQEHEQEGDLAHEMVGSKVQR